MTPNVSSARLLFARLTAVATFLLVFAGGLVTSTGSALAVPDWPLSFGQFFPPMVGGILYEHGHRMIAGTVAILTTWLAIWTWRADPRPGVRWLGVAAVLAVILQALLGGLTVLFLLPTPISVAHACFGQIFFCLIVTMAIVCGPTWTGRRGSEEPNPQARGLGALATATVVVVFMQLLLGALMRHTGAGLAIPDFPLAFGRIVPEIDSGAAAIHFAHRAWALVVAAMIVTTAFRARATHDPRLARPALALVALVALQILFGGIAVWTQTAAFPTTVHVAVGAAILATSVNLTLWSRRAAATRRSARGNLTPPVRTAA